MHLEGDRDEKKQQMVGPFFQETVPSKEMEQKTGPCAFCTKEEELEDH